jgi:hypothetical protein
MSASNDGVLPPPIARPITLGDGPKAERLVGPHDVTTPDAGRAGPSHELAISLMSDRGLRGMIEIWFEVEKMKSNHIPAPDFAGRLRKCEERIHGAIMRLANQAAITRSGDSGAVTHWMEAVARGKAETVSALAELRSKMTE